jgi:ribosome modulation factor
MPTQQQMQQQDAAEADGVLSGVDPQQQAADCPFSHREVELRSAWLQGFSAGRLKLKNSEEGQ